MTRRAEFAPAVSRAVSVAALVTTCAQSAHDGAHDGAPPAASAATVAPAWTSTPPSIEHFGFSALPARPARGVRGRARRPRRARRDADRLGQVALLPAAGADARRPDDRRLAAGLAHAGPGREPRAPPCPGRSRWSTPSRTRPSTATSWTARCPASCGCSTSPRSGSPRPGSSSGSRRPGSGCSSSTRPTASRSGATTSGPTTSASATPPATWGPGRSSPRRPPRRRGWPTTSRRGWGCATRCGSRPGSTGRTLSFAVVPCRNGADSRRRIAAVLAEPAALPAIVYAGTRNGCRRPRRGPALRARARGGRLPRRARPRGARRGPAPLHGRRRRRRRGDQRLRHGRRQGRRADGDATRPSPGRSRPTTRRPGARAATASRRGRSSSPRPRTRACTSSSSSGRSWTTRASAGWPRRCVLHAAEGGRYDLAHVDRWPGSPAATATASGRSSATSPAPGSSGPRPSSVDQVAGRLLAPFDGAALARCRTAAAEAQRARWQQYRAVWAFVESTDLPPRRRSCATSATTPRRRPRCRAATSATRR